MLADQPLEVVNDLLAWSPPLKSIARADAIFVVLFTLLPCSTPQTRGDEVTYQFLATVTSVAEQLSSEFSEGEKVIGNVTFATRASGFPLPQPGFRYVWW